LKVTIPIPSSWGTGEIFYAELTMSDHGNGTKIYPYNFPVTEEHGELLKKAVPASQTITKKHFESDMTLRTIQFHESVTGHSWEMMLALGLSALLTGGSIRRGLTGSAVLNERGELLPVGGINNKIRAAIRAGYSLFLVSTEQKFEDIPGIHILPVRILTAAWDIARTMEVQLQS